jgi:hypothetical protein
MRQIRFRESKSSLEARCNLLQDKAPCSADFLWQLAQGRHSFPAMHAIWTGPELSCPLPASLLPDALSGRPLPEENATSFPEPGDVVLASLRAGAIKGLPPGNFFDLGLFYHGGGRLLMPFGWIKANVCARVIEDDMPRFQQCMQAIRRNGECRLEIEPID